MSAVRLPPGRRRNATVDITRLAGELFGGYRSSGRRDKVLILSERDDKHADAVALHLFAQGTGVVRFDIESYPASGTMTLRLDPHDTGVPAGGLGTSVGHVPLEDVRSVWLRPDHRELFGLDPPTTPLAAFVRRESQATFDGLVAVLESAFWVNRPTSLYTAGSKVRQLKVARELGFRIPRTLVTNQPDAARRFVEECGGDVVVKAFRGVIGPRSDPSVVFTTRVLPDRLADLPLVRDAPCLFQERVPNDSDVRASIVGRTVFAVEVGFQPQDDTDADWRKVEHDDTPYRVIDLPSDVEKACLALMDHFALAAASVDLVRRPDGQYVFLEVNPQLNWIWLEARTGLPIARAMADLLARGTLAD